MRLRSPCANCNKYNIPHCMDSCTRIMCFQIRLSKYQVLQSCVLTAADISKIVIVGKDD